VSAEVANLESIWAGDLLGRRTDAQFLKQFLVRRVEERPEEGRSKSYVLNLDAGWGQGKTFFLTRLKRELEAEGYLAVYVNAWEDDHAEDPMIAVMSAIDEAVSPRLKKKKALIKTWEATKSSFKEIAVTAVTHGLKKMGAKLLGEGADVIGDILANGGETPDTNTAPSPPIMLEAKEDVGEQVAEALSEGVDRLLDRYGEEALKRFRKEKSSTISFKDNLSKFLCTAETYKDIRVPLFVIVDELDRCRPSYAIELLERVKHLFEVDNVVFVIGTDSSQLRHAIKAVYGESFESGRYLLRFFDRSYVFEEPSLDVFSHTLFERFGRMKERLSSPFDTKHEAFFSSVIRYFGLSLRDAEQCFDHLRTVTTLWPHQVKIELTYLLPLIIAFQQGNEQLRSLLEGSSREALLRYLGAFNSRNFEFTYSYRDEDSFRTKKRNIDFSEILGWFVASADKMLDDIIRDARSHTDGIWLGDVFELESRARYNSTNGLSSTPKSLICKYPEMVRNAGRILAAV
jgi:hypothetical protein